MHWYIYRSLKVELGVPMPDLAEATSRATGIRIKPENCINIAKKSLDARKKHQPFWLIQVEFCLKRPLLHPLPQGISKADGSVHTPDRPPSLMPLPSLEKKKSALVIGSGPAGLFAALALGEAGIQTTLVERGKPVETRMKDIGILRSRGILNPESNVCFGEGGAGTYTDGKLYTRVKNPFLPWVMARLVEFGGPQEIVSDAHPHLGTDKLISIIKAIRSRLKDIGVNIIFNDRVEQLVVHKGRATGAILLSGAQLEADFTVLGIGHSARETLEYLYTLGLKMSFKPFAVGVRVEHPQELIDQSQFGVWKGHPDLGAAEYRLSYQHTEEGAGQRGVYSFCMCPGGFIVPTPTEPGKMALNGMSNANRSTPYANSGIVVQVSALDLHRHGYQDHPLMGIQFQRDIEKTAFEATRSPYAAPAMRLTDFVHNLEPKSLAPTHFRPGAEPYPLDKVLPDWINMPMKAAFLDFSKKINGYLTEESNLFAVESRTSSPVRIERNDNLESVSLPGLFPIGEGAGYAGGIVSAAMDGLKAAESILNLCGRTS